MSNSTYPGTDLVMRCAPGVHAAAFECLHRHVPPNADIRVLDLASGTGAWIRRLLDCGYRDIDATEISIKDFAISEISPKQVDLNTDYARTFSQQYDVITVIEIIEHLDDPRRFLRNLAALLAPQGTALLTTPNVTGLPGRIHFMRHGDLRFFREHDYHYQRHISPMTDTHVRLAMQEAGLTVIEQSTAGSFWSRRKRLLLNPIMRCISSILSIDGIGDVGIYLSQHSDTVHRARDLLGRRL